MEPLLVFCGDLTRNKDFYQYYIYFFNFLAGAIREQQIKQFIVLSGVKNQSLLKLIIWLPLVAV